MRLRCGRKMVQNKKNMTKQVAENALQDVFNGRNPSESERNWAEKTLAPALEKGPERPIGAASGVNLDEDGHARFTTISGSPVRRLYTPADLPDDWSEQKYLAYPEQPPYPRATPPSSYRRPP